MSKVMSLHIRVNSFMPAMSRPVPKRTSTVGCRYLVIDILEVGKNEFFILVIRWACRKHEKVCICSFSGYGTFTIIEARMADCSAPLVPKSFFV
jgi:hypothetical protein